MQLPTPNVLAVIPCYNEQKYIAEVVRQTRQILPVLVVDDGSTDSSADQAEAAGAHVIRQNPNQGKGAALMQGYRYALREGYDAVVMLDADGQHAPQEIPPFVDAFTKDQADLIIGERDFRKMPALRRRTNTFGTWVFSWAVGQHIPDNQSGFRLLSRRMMEATLDSRETNFEFEVEMIVLCVVRGYRLAWVPISTIYNDKKSHIKPLRHAIHFVRVMTQTRLATRSVRNQKR